MTTYHIKISRPRPSMNQDKQVFQAASYAEAVQYARKAFMDAKRTVTLYTGENGMFWWHEITENGIATDRNLNSGIAASETVAQ